MSAVLPDDREPVGRNHSTAGGMRYSYSYDSMDRLTRKSASGRTLLAMAYDGNGNRIRQTDVTGKVTAYEFDDLDRTVKVWDDGREIAAYAYHADGTVKRESHGPLEKAYFYDADQNVTGIRIQSGASLLVDNHYQYDGNGNRTLKRQIGGEIRYHFNPCNQLKKVEYPSYSEELFYDRAGNRTRRVFDGAEELYQYDPRNRLTRLTRNGESTDFAYDAACARTYYHYASDEMGSITHLTDEDGEVQNRYAYDAWGNLTECEETAANRFQYAGEQCDRITRQYYLRARFYNPVIARFTQEDTYRGAGLNLYAYCANNPVYYVDPSGHQPSCVKDAAAKHMADGTSKEEAYKKAYAEHVDQKLNDGSALPAQEREKLKRRAERLGMEVEPSANRQEAPRAETPKVGRQGDGGSGNKPYTNSRPSYGKNQVNEVWENAKDPITGKVYDPSGVEITWDKTKSRNGQWDMGHIPGEKYSEMHQLYMDDVISKDEFLEWYRNPKNYRPELPGTNRSHKYE